MPPGNKVFAGECSVSGKQSKNIPKLYAKSHIFIPKCTELGGGPGIGIIPKKIPFFNASLRSPGGKTPNMTT